MNISQGLGPTPSLPQHANLLDHVVLFLWEEIVSKIEKRYTFVQPSVFYLLDEGCVLETKSSWTGRKD